MAVFSGEKTLRYRPEILEELPNRISEISGDSGSQDVVLLADVSGRNCELYHDLTDGHILLHV